MVASEVDAQ